MWVYKESTVSTVAVIIPVQPVPGTSRESIIAEPGQDFKEIFVVAVSETSLAFVSVPSTITEILYVPLFPILDTSKVY